MARIQDVLDWEIFYKKLTDGSDAETPIKWTFLNDNVSVTLRTLILRGHIFIPDTMKELEYAAKAGNKAKAAPMNGKRKQLFSDIEKNEIKNLYASGMSKRSIAKMYRCDEKTIRRILL